MFVRLSYGVAIEAPEDFTPLPLGRAAQLSVAIIFTAMSKADIIIANQKAEKATRAVAAAASSLGVSANQAAASANRLAAALWTALPHQYEKN